MELSPMLCVIDCIADTDLTAWLSTSFTTGVTAIHSWGNDLGQSFID